MLTVARGEAKNIYVFWHLFHLILVRLIRMKSLRTRTFSSSDTRKVSRIDDESDLSRSQIATELLSHGPLLRMSLSQGSASGASRFQFRNSFLSLKRGIVISKEN
jgi:hypothetical protein